MKKLYRVTIEGVVFVLAEDHDDARALAHAYQEDSDLEYYAQEINDKNKIDHDWRNARPFTKNSYNGYEDNDPTCVQFLEQTQEPTT